MRGGDFWYLLFSDSVLKSIQRITVERLYMRFDVAKLGSAIFIKRGDKGLRTIAKESGVDASTISRIERGATPSLEHAILLCNWLGMPLDDFVTPQPTLEAVAHEIYRLWNEDKLQSDIAFSVEVNSVFETLGTVLGF
jgi:transcriptional regulator with XRE-family HTH domain